MNQLQYFPRSHSSRGDRAAFTLLELLTVVVLMIILMTLTVPAISSVLASQNLKRGGQQITDQILLGRQAAITRNRDVEIRFVRFNDGPNPGFRAMQVWMVDEGGITRSPMGKAVTLPDGVIVNSNAAYSPLVLGGGATVSGETNFPAYGNRPFAGFRFRANGQTDIPTGSGTNTVNYVILQNSSDTDSPPRNFFAIQINPLTGKVNTIRP